MITVLIYFSEIASLLLKFGAKPDPDNALMYAIDVGSITIVTLICEHLKAISGVSQKYLEIPKLIKPFKKYSVNPSFPKEVLP